MDWSRWIPAIITLVGWIFTMGLTVGRINNQEIVLEEHDERLGDHDQDIQAHTIAIADMKARKEGYAEGYKEGFKLHRQSEGRG